MVYGFDLTGAGFGAALLTLLLMLLAAPVRACPPHSSLPLAAAIMVRQRGEALRAGVAAALLAMLALGRSLSSGSTITAAYQ